MHRAQLIHLPVVQQRLSTSVVRGCDAPQSGNKRRDKRLEIDISNRNKTNRYVRRVAFTYRRKSCEKYVRVMLTIPGKRVFVFFLRTGKQQRTGPTQAVLQAAIETWHVGRVTTTKNQTKTRSRRCHRRGYVAADDAHLLILMRSLRGEMSMVVLCALLLRGLENRCSGSICFQEAVWKDVLYQYCRRNQIFFFTFFYNRHKERVSLATHTSKYTSTTTTTKKKRRHLLTAPFADPNRLNLT